jgi:hypothetical protein
VTPCPHPGIQVGGRCYFCCKNAALNGHRAKLSADQLRFVGVGLDVSPTVNRADSARSWLQPINPSTIDKQLEELSRLRDVMPG